MSWKILEHNDGAVLQLIVAGPTSVTVKAEGVVEGQGQIMELETTIGKLLALLVVAVLSFLVSTAFTVRAFWRAERRFDRSRLIGANVVNTAILGVFLLVYYLGNSAVPAAFR
jgi:hypothetical protein